VTSPYNTELFLPSYSADIVKEYLSPCPAKQNHPDMSKPGGLIQSWIQNHKYITLFFELEFNSEHFEHSFTLCLPFSTIKVSV
jgi:hypothetical protein